MENTTKQEEKEIELSIVVPCYKAEKFIKEAIKRRLRVLKSLKVNYELLIVLDGNPEKSLLRLITRSYKNTQVISYKKNHGKGFGVRYGMLHAKGKYIGYIDAGLDIDENVIISMYRAMKRYNCDIVIPSKRHKFSQVNYPAIRRLYSWILQRYIQILLGINVTDSQGGAKLFRREALLEIYSRALVKRFAFEAEMLAIAKRLGFDKFEEVPVKITHDFKSNVNLRECFRYFWDLSAIFYRLRIRRYYDKLYVNKYNKVLLEFESLRSKFLDLS